MFAWEFPPHLSGGLGTACFGLTQSLTRQKVDYEAFIDFMNVVTRLTFRIQSEKKKPVHGDHDLAPGDAERQNVETSTPVWAMNLESVPHGNVPDVKD